MGQGTATATRVIAVFEFVRVDEVALVLVLRIGFHKLGGERAVDRLIVGGVATLLHVR